MRWTTLFLGLSLVVAGCGDSSGGDAFVARDLSAQTGDATAVTRDLTPVIGTDDAAPIGTDDAAPIGDATVIGTDDAAPIGTDDAAPVGTDDAAPVGTDDAAPVGTDDAAMATPDMTVVMVNPDMTVVMMNPDMTVVASPDLTGVKPADMTGMPQPDLTAKPADMTGMRLPDMTMAHPDLSVKPADMTVIKDLVSPPDMTFLGPIKLAGGSFTIYGLTTDNYAVVGDITKKQIAAYPIAGGAPTVILANATITGAGAATVRVRGKVAFIWSAPNANNISPLLVWTSSFGATPKNVSMLSVVGTASASDDGTLIVFTFGTNGAGTLTSIRGSAVDGTNAKTYLNNVAVLAPGGTPPPCPILMSVVGNRYGVVGHCAAGSSAATITSLDLPAQKQIDVITGAHDFFSVDKAGSNIFVIDGTRNAKVVPIFTTVTANTPTIDKLVLDGFLSGDGLSIIYQNVVQNGGTNTFLLRRSVVKTPAPVTLVNKNVNGFVLLSRALSPDEKWVVFSANQDMTTGFVDLFLASAVTPNMVVTLNAMTTSGDFGSLYTADSSHVLYGTNLDPNTTAGTLFSRPVAGNPTQQGNTTAWEALARSGGSKIVYNDNFKAAGNGTADIHAVDTAGGPTTNIAVAADIAPRVSFAGDRVVYTLPAGGTAGLYVNILP